MIQAYDIALIPSQEILDLCLKFNASISNKQHINFKKYGQLPHITLLMGGLKTEDVEQVKEDLSQIKQSLQPLKVRLKSVHIGKFASGIEIEQNISLQDLHNLVINKFGNIFNNNVTKESVIALPTVTQGTVDIINNYQNKSILDNFDPHITIGDGIPDISSSIFPLDFISKDIRIARMGNYCTFIDM